MIKHTTIPVTGGLYWYYAEGKDPNRPEPVLIDLVRYGENTFKGFNGRTQSWLRSGEYLIGPQQPPTNTVDVQHNTANISSY